MRIQVDHHTRYSYEYPASGIVQALRVTPRNSDAQYIRHWRVDADVDGTMREGVDAFGNHVIMFYVEGQVTELTLTVTGEADVADTAGIVRAAERLPAAVYLRTTELTQPDAAILDWVRTLDSGNVLATLHALTASLHRHMSFDVTETDVATPAATAFAATRGVCQDFAHIFCAAARSLGVPARYVSGHLARAGHEAMEAAHAWVEALVPDLGWVAFDPANGICATDAYLRVAIGLDYRDAAPVRGARRGGGTEAMHVHVRAGHAGEQQQG
ncbi:transglutaminase family protein [Sphingomonas changnyeongensis]|uniref:Transglutaminase family protein n=1 Tax=Sphingomonas changnyeongensis TaxID=2698679 RepID=A0A7Z2NX92_9SPHN|nr:transglutaminase family protein [Sphingomonas changnyeongensis]QHL91523.1 transglutaminase family protein [Sphingomonas changnyeongensis]